MYVRKRARAARFGRMHGKRKLVAAGVLTLAACTFAVTTAPSTAANAQEGFFAASMSADSDGNVPVQSVCFGAVQSVADDQYVAEQQYTGDQYVDDTVGEDQYSSEQYGEAQYSGAQYAASAYGSENLGTYNWYNDGFATYGTISVDDCALDAAGAGAQDRERVMEHERGHANGLPHSDDPNDIMYPIVSILGN